MLMKREFDLGDVFGLTAPLWDPNPFWGTSSFRSEQYIADDGGLTYTHELPGVDPKDLDIVAEDGHVIVGYKRNGKERSLKVLVNRDYDAQAATADLKLGILTLRFPRNAKAKGKRIELISS